MTQVIKEAAKHYKNGNYAKTMELCKKVLAKDTDFNALRLMGLSLYHNNMLRDSLAMFEYAERIDGNDLQLQIEKIDTLMRLGEAVNYKHFVEVALKLRKITRENSDNFRAHKQLKDVYMKMLLNNNAQRVIDKFLKANPESQEMHYENYGFLMQMGEFDKAKEALDKAISLDKLYALDFNWEKVNKGYDTQERIDQLIKINDTVEVNDSFKSFYYLSRAFAHQKDKDFEQAFKYFQKANSKYRKLVKYNPQSQVNFYNHLIHNFTKEYFNKLSAISKKHSEPDIVPVFIVGMPRSGSTLIEKILCAHDEVSGVGEVNDFKENLLNILGDANQQVSSIAYSVSDISEDQLIALKERYIKLIKAKNVRVNKNSKPRYLVNKMLTNFQFLPLIKAIFPSAKIIHAKRDALDTCWSCYKMFFNGDDNYIYNLKELGFQFNLYSQLMEHWMTIVNEGDVFEMDHEKLTKNPEEEIRRLLDYCELDWDDKCIRFHEQVGTVRTASFEQVRKPIYHKERMAWQDYDGFLTELKQALTKNI